MKGPTVLRRGVIRMAIALAALLIAGCDPADPTDDRPPQSKTPVQKSETSESGVPNVATPNVPNVIEQESIFQPSDDVLPTLPTTPIESLPNSDAPSSITTTSEVDSLKQEDQANVLAKGNFASGEHSTQGSLTIVDDEGIPVIKLGQDFQTANGPDLVIVLHRAEDPLVNTQPPAYSLKDGDYVEIASLKSTQGQQSYSIPAAIILDNYNSIAIWCRKFNATFGAASFQ